MKIHPAVIVVFAVLSADAAQWSPTTGGNLDDPSNWGSGYSTFAIRKAQSAPFTISSSPTNLPGAGTLQYDNNANTYTNDFGVGGVLDLQYYSFNIKDGAQVVQRSGKILSGGTSSLAITASQNRETGYWLDGADSAVEMPNLSLTAVAEGTAPAIYPHFAMDNGALATFTAVTAAGKGVIDVAGGATLTANAISVQNGSVMTATQATVVVNTPSGSKLTPLEVLNGGQIEIVDSTFRYTGGTTFNFNGDAGSLISFKDSTVEFGTQRVGMIGETDGLTIRFDNSTATHTGDQLFITGGGTTESGDKTLVFAGANPHLSIQGNKGLHFRGGTVSLQFEIPAAGFPTDHPVLDLTHAEAKFAKDSSTVPTLSVKASPRCPPGVYTLLRGKNATTIISDENMSCDLNRAKFVKTQVDGVDALQLKVGGGLILLLK